MTGALMRLTSQISSWVVALGSVSSARAARGADSSRARPVATRPRYTSLKFMVSSLQYFCAHHHKGVRIDIGRNIGVPCNCPGKCRSLCGQPPAPQKWQTDCNEQTEKTMGYSAIGCRLQKAD